MQIERTGNSAKKNKRTGMTLSDGTFLSAREQEELTHRYRGTNGWKKLPIKVLSAQYEIPLDELKIIVNKTR